MTGNLSTSAVGTSAASEPKDPTTMGGASVLPTDRPLTAGDVPLLREGADECSTCHGPANPAHYCDRHTGGPWCDDCWKVGDCAELHGQGCHTMAWAPMDTDFSDGLDQAFVSRPATSAASEGEGAYCQPRQNGPEALLALSAQMRDLISERNLPLGPDVWPDHVKSTVLASIKIIEEATLGAALASPPSERERELEGALRRAADDLRDIGSQNPKPSNSPDPEHENYLRRTLISLAQTANTRARRALTAQPAGEPTHG